MITLNNLSKKFRIPHERRDTLFENVKSIFKPFNYNTFYALKDVSLKIDKGECIGIIGSNGSGKSTLLRLLAKILIPNQGNIEIKGKIIPFLELGLGFNGDLTVEENIYLNLFAVVKSGMFSGIQGNVRNCC